MSRENAKHVERSELNITYEEMLLLNILRPLFNVAIVYSRLSQREIADRESGRMGGQCKCTAARAICDLSKGESASRGAGILPDAFFTKLNFYSELGNRA